VVTAAASGFLATLISTGAHAANPRVTLKLENATLSQAAESLAKATGIVLQVYAHQNAAGTPGRAGKGDLGQADPASPGEPRYSFDWKDQPFASTLRDLCRKAGANLGRGGPGRFILYPTQAPIQGAPEKPVGLVLQNGVRMYVRSVHVNDNRAINFGDAGGFGGGGSMQITVSAELGDVDADSVSGFTNVSARDDLGTAILPASDFGPGGMGGYGGQFPDEWNGGLYLTSPHPRAKKLAWIEGDLLVYRVVRQQRVEMPMPAIGASTRQRFGDSTIVVAALPPIQEPPEAPDDALPQFGLFPGRPGASGLRIRVRTYAPISLSREQANFGAFAQPMLIGRSGKVYPGLSSEGSRSAGNQDWQFQEAIWTAEGISEPITRIAWQWMQRERPERLLSFRMTDVPLPERNGLAIQVAQAKAPSQDQGSAEDRPFYEKGGASLESRVDLLGQPAAEGTVMVGLAPRAGAGWGPVRWVETSVGPDGAARLADIKPGRYRVVRAFRHPATRPAPGADASRPPNRGPALSSGRWLNSETEVELTTGAPAVLPPLRWVAEPGEESAGGTRTPAPPRRPAAPAPPAAKKK
jgi:hypothetical protein